MPALPLQSTSPIPIDRLPLCFLSRSESDSGSSPADCAVIDSRVPVEFHSTIRWRQRLSAVVDARLLDLMLNLIIMSVGDISTCGWDVSLVEMEKKQVYGVEEFWKCDSFGYVPRRNQWLFSIFNFWKCDSFGYVPRRNQWLFSISVIVEDRSQDANVNIRDDNKSFRLVFGFYIQAKLSGAIPCAYVTTYEAKLSGAIPCAYVTTYEKILLSAQLLFLHLQKSVNMSLKNSEANGSLEKALFEEKRAKLSIVLKKCSWHSFNANISEVRNLLEPVPEKLLLYCSDASIARYLRARNWNVKKAVKMLKETLKWRLEYKPEDIRWVCELFFMKSGAFQVLITYPFLCLMSHLYSFSFLRSIDMDTGQMLYEHHNKTGLYKTERLETKVPSVPNYESTISQECHLRSKVSYKDLDTVFEVMDMIFWISFSFLLNHVYDVPGSFVSALFHWSSASTPVGLTPLRSHPWLVELSPLRSGYFIKRLFDNILAVCNLFFINIRILSYVKLVLPLIRCETCLLLHARNDLKSIKLFRGLKPNFFSINELAGQFAGGTEDARAAPSVPSSSFDFVASQEVWRSHESLLCFLRCCSTSLLRGRIEIA
ncbi:hypothetical protein IEQ34_015281 [Dendrobium chrysotoxum]|uniref:CRAL/TRIO N-terminal domain-containing protein n=1 Tax=Dendrobium chrysotoxum TaxID=161865 RepID=A0AAV7G083_DENCH|nr:hypothetical protein IEQ34_015281 [Dendrobium chrysotoxum]